MTTLTFPMSTDFDFATEDGSDPLLLGFKFCVGYKVISYVEDGPGGGWPNFYVEFNSEEELRTFVMKYCNNDQAAFDDTWETIINP